MFCVAPVGADLEAGVAVLRRAHAAAGVVRRADALLGDPDPAGVELVVAVLVVHDGDRVLAGRDVAEVDARAPAGHLHGELLPGQVGLLREPVLAAVHDDQHLTVVAAQAVDAQREARAGGGGGVRGEQGSEEEGGGDSGD
jgi:hypothetical protein